MRVQLSAENKVADRVATQVVTGVRDTTLGALGINSTAQLQKSLHGLLGYYLPLLGNTIAASLPQQQQQQLAQTSAPSIPADNSLAGSVAGSSGITATLSSTGTLPSLAPVFATSYNSTAGVVQPGMPHLLMDTPQRYTPSSVGGGDEMMYGNSSIGDASDNGTTVDLQALYDNFLAQQRRKEQLQQSTVQSSTLLQPSLQQAAAITSTTQQRQFDDTPSFAGAGTGPRINAQVCWVHINISRAQLLATQVSVV